MENITISKKEYEELKQKSQLDEELLAKLIKGLEDVKEGRVREWKPNQN